MADSVKDHEKEILRRQQDPKFNRPGRGSPEQREEQRRQREAEKESEPERKKRQGW